MWKVFDIIDGAPAAPFDVGVDVVYIWMLPSALSVFYLLSLTNVPAPAHAGSFATDFISAFCLQRIQLLCFLEFARVPSEHVNVGFSLL
ncbi:hypothetical protein AVEN_140578-1 [Araneus ventricosus]|uniref:Uncharacterized protein n=1 Tax=Araneus ventricosus TaxID=182803 RepID=A0A4Y2KYR4_ARAVE|nr:hypothetical protein AVEN_140578-1 [Araneus ventricosus]